MAKMVVFKQYPRLNLPIKFVLLFAYTATLDPLVVASGYVASKVYDCKVKPD
jgi:hypothetical protein